MKKDLVETVDSILTEGFAQHQLMLSSDEISDVVEKHDELPSSIIVPKPITSETQSLGKEYYTQLKKCARIMVALQLEYERLRRAEKSPFYAKIMEYGNVIRDILSKKEINEQNVYHMQVENLAEMKNILATLVGYSRNVLSRFDGYEDDVGVELHVDRLYLNELSSKLPSLEALEKELASEIRGKSFEDDNFVPDYIRYNKLSKVLRRTRHSLDLVRNSVEYLGKELPLLRRLGIIFELSIKDAENISYWVSYYGRSLRKTEDLIFTQIEIGRNVDLINQQTTNITKMVFELYKIIGLSGLSIEATKQNSLNVYDRSMNELQKLSSNLQASDSWGYELLDGASKSGMEDGKGK